MGGYVRKKICSSPHCPNYALPNSAYCEEHQKEAPSRDSTSKYKEFYNSGIWKKLRRKFLISHIYCDECLKQGKYSLSNTVHHSLGFNSMETFLDQSKWVALCSSCHSKIHTKVTNEELYNQNKEKW